MSRVILSVFVVALVALAAADGDAGASYPPPAPAQDASAALPYPYAQAQKDSYAADAQYASQAPTYEGVYYSSQAAHPGYPLAALKAEALTTALSTATWVVSHVAAAALGSLLALGVCKLTPLCSLLAHHTYLRSDAPGDDSAAQLRSFTGPALTMLRSAIDKYAAMNA